jgi:hypothetical protein
MSVEEDPRVQCTLLNTRGRPSPTATRILLNGFFIHVVAPLRIQVPPTGEVYVPTDARVSSSMDSNNEVCVTRQSCYCSARD